MTEEFNPHNVPEFDDRSLEGLDEEELGSIAAHLAGLLGHQKGQKDLGFSVPETPELSKQIKNFTVPEMRAYLGGYLLPDDVVEGLIDDIFGPKPE